ncbi:hypothetical protein L9F63_010137, partial [Diploptera punctata]
YYQPAGPLISAHHHRHTSSSSGTTSHSGPAPVPVPTSTSTAGESSDNDVIITATSCSGGGEVAPPPLPLQHPHQSYAYNYPHTQYYPSPPASASIQYSVVLPTIPRHRISITNHTQHPLPHLTTDDIYSTPVGNGSQQNSSQSQQQSQQMVVTGSTTGSASSYQPPSAPPPPSLVGVSMDPYPPPPGYYTGYTFIGMVPLIINYQNQDAAYQSCPCPMQSCPKNVHTGPLTGDGMPPPPSPATASARNPNQTEQETALQQRLWDTSNAESQSQVELKNKQEIQLTSLEVTKDLQTLPDNDFKSEATVLPTDEAADKTDITRNSLLAISKKKRQNSSETAITKAEKTANVDPKIINNTVKSEVCNVEKEELTENKISEVQNGRKAIGTEVPVTKRCKLSNSNVGSRLSDPVTSIPLNTQTVCKNRQKTQSLSSSNCSMHNGKNVRKRKLDDGKDLAEIKEPASKKKSIVLKKSFSLIDNSVCKKVTGSRTLDQKKGIKMNGVFSQQKKPSLRHQRRRLNIVRNLWKRLVLRGTSVKLITYKVPANRRTSVGSRKEQCRRNNSVFRSETKTLQLPKWSNGWQFEGEPFESKVFLSSDDVLVTRKCYPLMRHQEGDVICPRDCILLKSGPRKTDLPFVAKVAALWENPEDGEMMVSLLWYYRPEHTDQGRRADDMEDEIFASKHKDINSVACIEDKCYVLTFNEYCRYRKCVRRLEEGVKEPGLVVPQHDEYPRENKQPPGCVPQSLCFFCRRVYDFRQRRILKNPGICTITYIIV